MVVPINEELSGSEEPTSSYPKEHMAPSVIALTASKRLSIIIAHFFALGQITPDLHIEGQRLIGNIFQKKAVLLREDIDQWGLGVELPEDLVPEFLSVFYPIDDLADEMAELLESTTEPPDFDLVEAKVDEIGEAFSVLYDSKSWVKHVPPAYVPILSALLSRSFVIGFWGTKAVDRTEAILKGAGQLTDWHIDNSAHIHLNEVGKIEATRLSSKEMVKRALSKIRDGFYAKEIWSMGGLAKARLNEDGRTYTCRGSIRCYGDSYTIYYPSPTETAGIEITRIELVCPGEGCILNARGQTDASDPGLPVWSGTRLHDFVEHLDGRRSRKRCKCFKGHPDSYADAYPHDHVDE